MRTPDKRRTVRVRRRVKVIIDGHVAFTADLASAGFCVELMHVHKPGTAINGVITFNGCEYSFDGQVRWSRAGDTRLGVVGRMGIQFVRLAPGFARSIQAVSG